MTSLHSVAPQGAVSKANHYPSLELCKKLTEAGFLEETSCHFRKNNSDTYEHTFWPWNDESYVCPSVIVLLDLFPTDIITDKPVFLFIGMCDNWFNVYYSDNMEREWWHFISSDTLPNALAEMYLFLKENWYIWK